MKAGNGVSGSGGHRRRRRRGDVAVSVNDRNARLQPENVSSVRDCTNTTLLLCVHRNTITNERIDHGSWLVLLLD